MKFRPCRLFIVSLVVLFALGATGIMAWQRANLAGLEDRASSSFFELAKGTDRLLSAFNEPPTEQALAKAGDFIESMKQRFPVLASEKRTVLPEENGFLQLCLLSGMPLNPGPDITPELVEILNSTDPVNLQEAGKAFAENAKLVERIGRIAAMPDRSAENMPHGYNGFIDAKGGKYAADILLLKARLAAAAGNEPEALNLVRGAFNIGRHYGGLETRSLLSETISIVIDLNTRKAILEHIIPALGSGADPAAWRGAMPAAGYTPADFAEVMRGEWETTARHVLFPVILDPHNKNAPDDGEALALAISADFSGLVTDLRDTDLSQLSEIGFHANHSRSKSLSSESREISEIFYIGMRAWGKGYARAASIIAQYEVALDLLVFEKSGGVLESPSAGNFGADPFSGKPFIFDPIARTLSAPDDDREINPLVLP